MPDAATDALQARPDAALTDAATDATVIVPDAHLAAEPTEIISVSSAGVIGDSDSGEDGIDAISADGRFIVFASFADTLVANDGNTNYDIFLRDTLNNTTTLVSQSSAGVQSDSESDDASISADGRYVAFDSLADNLVANETGAEIRRIFIRDTGSNTTTLISLNSNGDQANDSALEPSMSGDGRFVAFVSPATNLAPDDNNDTYDIFLRDTQNNVTTLVSSNPIGNSGDNSSYSPHLSSNGTFVAFHSTADDLVANDSNDSDDVFLRDLTSGETTRISVDSNGTQADADSSVPYISADGRFVAFASSADNLVANDSNSVDDVFLRDTASGITTRVSVDSNGNQADADSYGLGISGDGRFVVFASDADNLVADDTNAATDVFVHDTLTGVTTRISVDDNGNQGDQASIGAVISRDGTTIAFTSLADNFNANDTNQTYDEFETSAFPQQGILPRASGERTSASGKNIDVAVTLGTQPSANVTVGLSVSSAAEASLSSQSLTFTPNDWNVAQHVTVSGLDDSAQDHDVPYTVNFANAVSDDPTYGGWVTPPLSLINVDDVIHLVSVSSGNVLGAANTSPNTEATVLSADGRFVAFESGSLNLVDGENPNVPIEVFIRDTALGTTNLVSVGVNGAQVNNFANQPSISGDGRFVAFLSAANNLVANYTPSGSQDIYVRDTIAGTTALASTDSSGDQSNASSAYPSISSDGNVVAFYSVATNLVANDTNGFVDVFAHNMSSGVTSLVSVDSDGNQANAASYNPAVSADGRFVAFYSSATNLVTQPNNAHSQIYLRDTLSNTTTLVSCDSLGNAGDDNSDGPTISADGRYIAFESGADNLVGDDTNGVYDVFVHDMVSGITTRVSVASSADQADVDSYSPSISADGRLIAFSSSADNLVANDTNMVDDIFLRDTLLSTTTILSVNASGIISDNYSFSALISPDGNVVVFGSLADNLVADDDGTNEQILITQTGISP